MNNKKQIVDALKASGLVEDTGASVKPDRQGGDGESKPTFAGAIMSEQLNECRAEFEKWATPGGYALVRHPDRIESYYNAYTEDAWLAWQAAWNRRAVPTVPEAVVRLIKAMRSQQSLGYFTNDYWQDLLLGVEQEVFPKPEDA